MAMITAKTSNGLSLFQVLCRIATCLLASRADAAQSCGVYALKVTWSRSSYVSNTALSTTPIPPWTARLGA